MSSAEETLKALEERRGRILEELQRDHADLAMELESLNSVIERYKVSIALSLIPESQAATPDRELSTEWSHEKFPWPRQVIIAILRKHGGRANREQIITEAVEGGWRRGSGTAYWDIYGGLEYLISRGKIKAIGKDTVELVWSAIKKDDGRASPSSSQESEPES